MVSVVVAIDSKKGIGKNNDLLFHIDADFKRMHALIKGHPLVMGRKTFQSIGRKLPNNTSIVITRDPKNLDSIPYKADIIVSTLEEGLEAAKKAPGADEIVVFGGGQIFKEAMEKDLIDVLHLTIVDGDYNADTFFPDYSEFTKVLSEQEGQEGDYHYRFLDLGKN